MTEQWPPEWGDPDTEDVESQDPGIGDLAEVTSALASIPMPALPDAFEARISAAIAAEAGQRPRLSGTVGESATARSLSADESSPAGAGGGTATAPPRRFRRERARRPAHSRPPGQRRHRILSAPVLGTMVVCLLFAGFGFVLSRGASQSSSSSSEASGAFSGSSDHSSFAAPAAGAAGSAPKTARLPDGATTFLVTHSGTSYQSATLAGQVRARLATINTSARTPGPSESGLATPAASAVASAAASGASSFTLGTSSVPSSALKGCVDSLTHDVAPSLVDRASYAGKAAYIIAVPSKAWVVGLGCTAANPELITTIALTGLSGNLCALGSV